MGESALEQVSELSYLFKDLINNIGAAIYLVQDRKFIFVNPFFEFRSGYSAAELIGHNPLDFVHPDDRETVREKAIDALKESGSRAPSYEYRFIQKSGEIMWVIERVSSIEYKGRRAVLGSFMVITRRKMLEEALRKS
jgi:PAS domain S-box-containing protein